MSNAIVMTGYGPPEVLKWAAVPLPEPGEGQIRIKVKAAGISPTDLVMRAGYLKDAIPLPPDAVLGFEAAGMAANCNFSVVVVQCPLLHRPRRATAPCDHRLPMASLRP